MKKLAVIISFVMLPLICFASGAGTRVETIRRIENLQLRSSVFPPDSPFLADMLRPALRANPDVKTKEWDEIRGEISAAISRLMTQPDGPMDTMYRTALEPMSDVELERLEALLNDPVWLKFTASMASSTAQQQVIKALMANALQMGAVLDSVLVRRGLKPAH